MSSISDQLLHSDPFKIFPATEAWLGVRSQVVETTKNIVGELMGSGAREQLDQVGLERMHEVLPAERVGELREPLSERLSVLLYQWAATVSRDVLGFSGEFFLDEKIYFRFNYPFEVAVRAPKPSPPKGLVGKLNAKARELRPAGALKDRLANVARGKGFVPTLDLVRYNRNRPRPTWAHGPHIDTWYGHAFGSINFWWAIAGVNESNSMVLFPDSHKKSFPFEKENMYLARGVRTPTPRSLAMKDGELALFDAELLHSTRLNTSDETRFVVTLRVNEDVPTFSDDTTHAIYDLWHSSEDVDQGKLSAERRGLRVPHKPYPPFEAPQPKAFRVDADYSRGKQFEICRVDALEEMNVICFNNTELLLFRQGDDVRCTAAICPHVGRSLTDGHVVDGKIQCPAHGVRYCLDSGKGDCESLRLQTYKVAVQNGTVSLVP